MPYDPEKDEYTCAQGKKLKAVSTVTRKSETGYKQEVTIYACEDCSGCPVKEKCIRQKKTDKTPLEERVKRLNVSKYFISQRTAMEEKISTEEGILLRINRSIQAEGVFAMIKEDMNFRRFLTRGKANVTVEWYLVTVVISPVGYSGKRKRADLAYELYGMVIDLDNVGTRELESLVYQMENGILPMATYLKNSGTGIHVVYLFEEPMPAYKKYYDSLNRLKAALSDLIWSQYTSRETDKQFQGIFQSFRVVGSPTKLGDDYRVSAYKIGEKTTIEELNWYVSKKNRCNLEENEGISLADARELYPEWYQRRIVEGREVGDYKLTPYQRQRRRGWYNAWVARIKREAKDGNRHFCIGVLFHYAIKAEIPLEEAYQDALALLPYLNGLTQKPGNEFTVADIDAAKGNQRKQIPG